MLPLLVARSLLDSGQTRVEVIKLMAERTQFLSDHLCVLHDRNLALSVET